MIGFNYSYISSHEILEKVNHLFQFGVGEICILILGILLIFGNIFYILPILGLYSEQKREEKEKKRKRQLINKIVLQKNIEDVIAKELKQPGN